MPNYTVPHLNHSCLITIDTQNDFTIPGAVVEIPGTIDVIPNMVSVLNAYRRHNLPIVHVIRIYKDDGSNVDFCRKEMVEGGTKIASPGSQGYHLYGELLPNAEVTFDSEALLEGEFQKIAPNEWVMYKSRWGAFYKTNLEDFLHSLDVDTLVFTGCNFPNCPRTSIYQASERDFRIVFIKDAVSQTYDKGIQELSNIGVECLSTDDFLARLKDVSIQ